MPWCLVEDETTCRRIGWTPYHVGRGFDINESAVTVASALMWGNNMAPSTDSPERIMQLVAWDMTERCQFALGSGRQYTCRTILMTGPVARLLKEKYPDKDKFEKALVETARRPLYERTFANYFANPGSRIDEDRYPFSRYEKRIQRIEDAWLTEVPVWYALPDGCASDKMLTIPVMKQGMTAILLTGDSARNKVQVMPGGGYSTIKIDLPDDWDRLMAEKGYAPLSEFFYSPH